MTQRFPEIKSTDYIYKGIVDLQDRDDCVLTMFSGETEPVEKFEDLVWNDLSTGKLKYYKNGSWIEIVNSNKDYLLKSYLSSNYQPLNSNLTTYSNVTVNGLGFVTTEFVPISSFYINEIAKKEKSAFKLGSFADKNKLANSDFENNIIEEKKLNPSIITKSPTKVGDTIVSFNAGVKNNFVKLSNSNSINYTIGSFASASTYKGDEYKSLYNFIWNKKFSKIYTSSGAETTKGNDVVSDWSSNKRLLLPKGTMIAKLSVLNGTYTSIHWVNNTLNISGDNEYIVGVYGDSITVTVTSEESNNAVANFTLQAGNITITLDKGFWFIKPDGTKINCGEFVECRAGTSPSEDYQSWVYGVCIKFRNGYLGYPVGRNDTSLNLNNFIWENYQFDTTDSYGYFIKSVVFSPDRNKWYISGSEDLENGMIWSSVKGDVYRSMNYITATMMDWNDGHNRTSYCYALSYEVSPDKKSIRIFKWGTLIGTINTTKQTVNVSSSVTQTQSSLESQIQHFMRY